MHLVIGWATQKGAFSSLSSGNTKTHAVYIQDKWQITPLWALTSGRSSRAL